MCFIISRLALQRKKIMWLFNKIDFLKLILVKRWSASSYIHDIFIDKLYLYNSVNTETFYELTKQ